MQYGNLNMSSVEQRATELRGVFQEVGRQFQAANSALADGLHGTLSNQERRVLDFLGREGPQMMRVLAEYLNLAVNSVTTVADGLEEKRLVRRQRSDEDRRVVRVDLTEYGHKVYREVDSASLQFFQAILDPLTGDEQEILLVLMRKVARMGFSQGLVAVENG